MDEPPLIVMPPDFSAAATLANRSAAASNPATGTSVRLPHLLTVAIIVMSSLAVHVRETLRERGEVPAWARSCAALPQRWFNSAEARSLNLKPHSVGIHANRRPSDQDSSRRRPTRTGHSKRGNASAKQTRRTRKDDRASDTYRRDSTDQTMDDSLTRIMPKQQRQHQQHRRCQLQDAPDTYNRDKRNREDDANSQPKREVRTSTISRHAPEYTRVPTP